jgi:hypothetical protein
LKEEIQMNTAKRFSVVLLAVAALGTSAFALAETGDSHPQCDGNHEHGKGAFFKRADKNGDGALTKDEVGEKRWERIKLADANNDGKVTQEELRQARESGKLPHHDGHSKA